MSDDLVKRLRERADNLRNVHGLVAAADDLDEAATRLATPPGDACPDCGGNGDSGLGFATVCQCCDGTGALSATPPGDAVEVVARAIYWRLNNIMHDHDALWEKERALKGQVWMDVARAALSAIPERAHGEQMREAAARVCEKEALACLGGRVVGDEGGRLQMNAMASVLYTVAADIRALPLPPAEERT